MEKRRPRPPEDTPMLESNPESSQSDSVAQLRTDFHILVGEGNWKAARLLLEARPELLVVSGDLTALYGEVLLRTGRNHAAREWLTKALVRLEPREERVALRRVMNLLGVALFELGLLEDAAAMLEHVAELARRIGDDLLLAKARNNL